MKDENFYNSIQEALPAVPRWTLPSSKEQVADWLQSTYRVLVARRHDTHPDSITLSDGTKANLTEVADWLTDETARRWLLLRGTLGNGKTTTLHALQAMIKHLYRHETQFSERVVIVTARQIADLATEGNREALEELQRERILAIDDIGVEPATTRSYGNYSAPVVELLYSRYDHRRLTIISTNLVSNSDLSERYGFRLYDRLREMAKIVAFSGGSFRGGQKVL